MARGGIYDQLAGGFARYSVDAGWVVPHFEKMLYDNALLLGVYTHWWRRRRNPLAERVVAETVDWLLAEMRTGGGRVRRQPGRGLRSMITGHLREGAFYAWTPDQLAGGARRRRTRRWAGGGVRGDRGGNLRGRGLDAAAAGRSRRSRRGWTGSGAGSGGPRSSASRPARDDKVVAAWNGWLIDSLVQAAMVFDRPEWLAAATEAAEAVWRVHWRDGRLRRASRDGRAGAAAGDPGGLRRAGPGLRPAGRGDRPTRPGSSGPGRCSRWCWTQFDDGGGGLLRHRGRRRAALHPAAGPDRQRHALRAQRGGPCAGADGRADRRGRVRRPGRAGGRAAPVAWPRRRRGSPAGCWPTRSAASGARTPVQVAVVGPDDAARAALVRVGPPAGAGRLGGRGRASRTSRASRCWPTGRCSTAGPPRTSAGSFVCRLPVTSAEELVERSSSDSSAPGARR